MMIQNEYLIKSKMEARKKLKSSSKGENGNNTNSKGKKRELEIATEEKVEETKVEEKVFTFDWKPRCVIRIKEVGPECSREAILDAVAKGLNVEVSDVKERNIYADFSRGQTEGAIRFKGPSEDIEDLCKKLAAGELEIAGQKVGSAHVLEGDEESTYWNDFIDFKQKQMQHRQDERNARHKNPRRNKKPRNRN